MDVDQAHLDARIQDLRDLAESLTPEQAERVKERVRDRISASNITLDEASVGGALELLFALPRGAGRLPDLLGGVRGVVGGAGRSVGDALSVVNPFGSSGGNGLGVVAEQAGAILGQLGDLLGRVGGVGGAVSTAGQALGQAGELAGAAGEVAGAAGEVATVILEAIGEVLGGLGDLSL